MVRNEVRVRVMVRAGVVVSGKVRVRVMVRTGVVVRREGEGFGQDWGYGQW